MKMLIILSGLHMGGIERMLLSSIPHYKSKGFNEIHLLATTGGQLEQEFLDLDVIVHKFRQNSNPLLQIVKVWELNRKYNFDIVNSNFGHTSGLLSLLLFMINTIFVVSVHNQKAMFKNGWENKLFLRRIRKIYLNIHKYLTIRFAKAIIGHSKTNLEYFSSSWANDKLYLAVKNGTDFSQLDNPPGPLVDKKTSFDVFIEKSAYVFIHIGSFKEQKNHKFLLETFAKLEPKKYLYKLVLLGGGSAIDECRMLAKILNIESDVLFLGIDMDVSYYLERADAFIFPSLYEGFGNVLIEAQYKRLPILASDIQPHYESVAPCYHKYFFKPTDEEAAVRSCRDMISIKNTSNMSKLINDGFEFASSHTVKNMTFEIADHLLMLTKNE